MTHASVQQRTVSPRAVPEIVVDRAVLAVLVLAGTLRGSSIPQSIADLLPATTPLVQRWYAWDVFRSLPFAGILTLLSVAISVCTINRAPGIWQAIAHPSVATTHGFLRNAETSASLAAPIPPHAFASQLESA